MSDIDRARGTALRAAGLAPDSRTPAPGVTVYPMCCESGGKAPLAARCLAGMAALRSGERVAETLGVAGAVVVCACSGLDRHAGQRPARASWSGRACGRCALQGGPHRMGYLCRMRVCARGRRPEFILAGTSAQRRLHGNWRVWRRADGVRRVMGTCATTWCGSCVRPSLSVGAPRDDFGSFYPNIVGLRLQCYGPWRARTL